MRDRGLQLLAGQTTVNADGQCHRCDVAGKKSGNRDGTYVLHLDPVPHGGFNNWTDGRRWENWSPNYKYELTDAERQQIIDAGNKANEHDKKLQAEINEEARIKARNMSQAADPAPDSYAYCQRKGVKPDVLKMYTFKKTVDTSLLVPVYDDHGKMLSLQFIDRDGKKIFLKGSRAGGGHFWIHKPKQTNDTIIVCEGWATGESIYQATGHAVVMSFGAGNLVAVAQYVRKKYPDCKLIIAADDNANGVGPGKAGEAARAAGGSVATPKWPKDRGEGDEDFNDMARLSGLKAVKKVINEARRNNGNGNAKAGEGAAIPDRQYEMVCAADVVIKPLQWLWTGHLLRGAQELMAGTKGLGKSQLQCHLVACATTGHDWPDGAAGTEPGNVIMVTAEDSRDQVVVPRLMAAGADLKRVFFLNAIKKDDKRRMFLLGEDLETLKQLIVDTGNVTLVTLDPITAFMGKIDSHNTTDVRGQLGPLADLAAETNVAFSTITHPPKSNSGKAIDQFIGSQAFIAAARIGHLVQPEMKPSMAGDPMPTGHNLFTIAGTNHQRMETLRYRRSPGRFAQSPPESRARSRP
jgi:putative DNA primase/helicase